MNDYRDTALGTALQELPVPEHRAGFWDTVAADLAGLPKTVDQEPNAKPDAPLPHMPREKASPQKIRRFHRWGWAFAAAAMIAIAIGVVAALQLFRGDPGPMIEDPTTTTTATTSPAPDNSVPDPIGTGMGPSFAVIDGEGGVGHNSSLVVGADGVPLIVYSTPFEESPLRLARCADSGCSGKATVNGVEPKGSWYEATMAMGPDGLPVYVWMSSPPDGEEGNSVVNLFKCTDPGCSEGTLSELGPGELSPDLAVGPDNLPAVLVSTWDGTATLIKCDDPACTTNRRNTIDEIGSMRSGLPKIAVGTGSTPVIATSLASAEGETPYVTVLNCSDPACAGEVFVSPLTVRSLGIEELAVSGDGVPVILTISMPEATQELAGDLVLIGCTDPACASPTVTVLAQLSGPLPGELGEGRFGSMAISPNNRVSVAYVDRSIAGGILTVATCTDPVCSGGVTHSPTQKVSEFVWTSTALNPQGNPVVAYNSYNTLHVMVCADPACTAPEFALPPTKPADRWETTIVDEAGARLEGFSPSVVIDRSGLPIIVYNSDEGTALVSCNDPACSDFSTTVLEGGGQASVVLTVEGLPAVISHTMEWDGVALTLCHDRSCADRETIRVFDEWVNGAPAIATSPRGAVVAYQHPSDWYVWVKTCLDDTCNEFAEGRLESLADPGEGEFPDRWYIDTLDIAVPGDGLPVIGVAQTDGTVRVVKCSIWDCTESTTVVVAETGSDQVTADLAIGIDGYPLMAYYNNGRLEVAVCHNPACQNFTVNSIDDSTSEFIASVGPDIEVGSDGLALIAYWTPTREMKLARCLDELCDETVLADVADLNTFGMAITADGSPVLAYYQGSIEGHDPVSGEGNDLLLARCRAGTCADNE